MGQIASILNSYQLPDQSAPEFFSIQQRLTRVTITYRQLQFQLPLQTFRDCARELQALNRDQVENFNYSSSTFIEAINFTKLTTLYPGAGKARWHKWGRLYRLCYRGIRLKLQPAEFSALQAHYLIPRLKPKDIFWRIARYWLRRPDHNDSPLLKERLSVDLCENIHIHFQNLRIEFDLNEFLVLWDAVSHIEPSKISPLHWGTLCHCPLPHTTEWNRRLQLEEQVEGHYHLHYRNLRIEFRDFYEIGIDLGSANPLKIDSKYMNRFVRPGSWKMAGIQTRKVGEIRVLVYTSTGINQVSLEDSPIYQSLVQNSRDIYDQYRRTVLTHDPQNDNDWDRFQTLLENIRSEGFDMSRPLVTHGSDHCLVDGQHRASILLYLFSADTTVKVVHYV